MPKTKDGESPETPKRERKYFLENEKNREQNLDGHGGGENRSVWATPKTLRKKEKDGKTYE